MINSINCNFEIIKTAKLTNNNFKRPFRIFIRIISWTYLKSIESSYLDLHLIKLEYLENL